MNFLAAQQTVAAFTGGEPLGFLLAMSGSATQLDLYLRAAAARHGRSAVPRTLPFNTLAQALLDTPASGEAEVFLLMPWDFVPEADWRSGLPLVPPGATALREEARAIAERLGRRPTARFVYVPAPLPPLFSDPSETTRLTNWVGALACSLGARVLPPDAFSLSTYLAAGCPIGGAWLGAAAEAVVGQVLVEAQDTCKVLVTDLDNVLWSGVIAEDGIDGIACGPDAAGYPHFLYQSLLARLQREGVVLAAVTRNARDVALHPFRRHRTLLGENDFVCVIAGYAAKSAQIDEIARRLNLGLESFVFVDDNPVEVAEVSAALPETHCVPFPKRADDLPEFFSRLSRLFARNGVTAEDRARTELYRRRLEGMPPSRAEGADLTSFLRGLDMRLLVHDRTRGDRQRAVQLINKTNQFNLNGRRVADEDVAEVLNRGGALYGVTLTDRTGTHGEILACVVSPEGVITSLVMSCRVFRRRVEYAFLAWLAARHSAPGSLDFAETPRNEPFRDFLEDPAFTSCGDTVRFDARTFATAHQADLALFTVEEPGRCKTTNDESHV